MEVSFQQVFVDSPFYLRGVTLITLVVALAALVALILGVKRRVKPNPARRGSLVLLLHLLLSGIVLAYLVALAVYWSASNRALAQYQRSVGGPAPTVRAAINRDIHVRFLLGGAVGIVVASSFVVWFQPSRPIQVPSE